MDLIFTLILKTLRSNGNKEFNNAKCELTIWYMYGLSFSFNNKNEHETENRLFFSSESTDYYLFTSIGHLCQVSILLKI